MTLARLAPWRAEAAATLSLAWPMILSQLAQMLLVTTDVLLLGRVGPDTVAAAALAINLHNAFMLFGVGVMTAVMPMVAAERGRCRWSVRDVRRTFHQSLWAAATLSIPMWLALWHGEALFHLLGQDPALAHEAARLLRVLMWSLFPFFAYLGGRAFAAALERPLPPLLIVMSAVPLNAFLAWVLIFGKFGLPALGLVGAGWATFSANVFLMVAMGVVLARHPVFRRYRLFGGLWRPDPERWFAFLRLGMPIGVMVAFETTAFNAAAFLAGMIGTETLAAHSITVQIAATSFMIPLGLSQASTVRVGLAHGRQDPRGMFVAGWTSFALVLAVMVTTATVMTFAPATLVGAFLDLADPANRATATLAIGFLAYAALFQIVDGIQVVTGGMLRGRQDTRVPMLLAGFGYWGIGLPAAVALAFPLGFAGRGVWIGLATGLATVALLLTWRWVRLTGHARTVD